VLPLLQTQGHQRGQDGLSCSALYVICVPEQMGLDSFSAEGFLLICLVVWLFGWFLGSLDCLLGTQRVSDCPGEDCMK